jgi:hypothetical protein
MTVPNATGPRPRQDAPGFPGMLDGLRVVELADESGEYVGMTLAGLGAEVIKLEPPGGAPTRAIGPFLGDEPGAERSLHSGTTIAASGPSFWIPARRRAGPI